jgi:hypothetical protein
LFFGYLWYTKKVKKLIYGFIFISLFALLGRINPATADVGKINYCDNATACANDYNYATKTFNTLTGCTINVAAGKGPGSSFSCSPEAQNLNHGCTPAACEADYANGSFQTMGQYCERTPIVGKTGPTGQFQYSCITSNLNSNQEQIQNAAANKPAINWSKVCDYDNSKSQECSDCFEKNGSWTAIGCVPSNPQDLLKLILTFGMGIAGGIAFLLILLGGFQIMTSAGNPEQLNAGRELVTSAVIGLILILLSIFLLKVIGVDVFGLPGFSSS